MMQLSKETNLLLFLSRVMPEAPILEQAQSLIFSGVDWESLLSISIKHGTSNFIYKNLLKLKHIPQDVLKRFQGINNNTIRSNIRLTSETDRLLDRLNEAGIETIVLKGPITSEKIFGNIGLYPSGDIDMLVKVDDIDRARRSLESEGYELIDKGFDEYRDFFIKELYHISLTNGRYTIEVHWNLFYRYFTAPPEFWWDESMIVASAGRQYRFLSPEKNILYTSFRLFSKAFSPLRFLVIVAEIVRYYKDETDWEKLFSYAGKYKFENVLRVNLRLSHDLLGAPAPERCISIKGLRMKMLHKTVCGMILKGDNLHPLNKVLITFLRDDISGAFKVLIRRMFPSMGEIVSRYKLPADSFKATAYYILNPILVLMNRHRDQRLS
ncbi:MAG: nucleotidyltransferase family protein [Nitrospirota bacterium]